MTAERSAEVDLADARAVPGARVVTAEAARSRLIAVSVLGGVATVTGTGIFCYPSTLGPIRRVMVLLHDASGDLLILAGIAYLIVHLRRTWRMKKRVMSRWTGYASVAVWIAAAATGVYGQVEVLESGGVAWIVHLISSVALIVLACFHGAWGFFKPARRS